MKKIVCICKQTWFSFEIEGQDREAIEEVAQKTVNAIWNQTPNFPSEATLKRIADGDVYFHDELYELDFFDWFKNPSKGGDV